MNRRFSSKVDIWLAVILVLCPLTPFAGDLFSWTREGRVSDEWSLHVFLFLATAVALILVLVPVDYTFRPEELLIRCGRIKKRIPYNNLVSVSVVSSYGSASALSHRRLQLDVAGGNSMRISPKDRDGFLEELRRRAPHVHIQQG